MGAFDGKTVLVTGGSTGIGLAAARRFVSEGATVFVTGRRQQALTEAAAQLGPQAIPFAGDVSNLADLDALFAKIRERGAALDVVFANAGGGSFATLEDTTVAHFEETFLTNVQGTLFTVQKAVPLMAPGSAIIATGSTAASKGGLAFGSYAASKAALRAYARVWALELAPRGIRVNVVVPGPIETPGLVGLAPDAQRAEALLAGMATTIPLGRIGEGSEVADAVAFLASPGARFITGSELVIDGGQTQV